MKVEVKNGQARINGKKCIYDSDEISFHVKKGKIFYLGDEWVCRTSPITGFVKIIKKKKQ